MKTRHAIRERLRRVVERALMFSLSMFEGFIYYWNCLFVCKNAFFVLFVLILIEYLMGRLMGSGPSYSISWILVCYKCIYLNRDSNMSGVREQIKWKNVKLVVNIYGASVLWLYIHIPSLYSLYLALKSWLIYLIFCDNISFFAGYINTPKAKL